MSLPASRALVLAVAVSVLVSACSSDTPGGGSPRSRDAAGEGADDPALIAQYGYGPRRDPAITYQPDVVLIGAGPSAIRGVSADGVTWRMDAHADGVDQLTEGKVMFAASEVVGRVRKLEPKGDVVEVTLVPVSIGEVISEGVIRLDKSLPLDSLTLSEVPQLARSFEDEPSNELTGGASSGDREQGFGGEPRTFVLAVARRNVRGAGVTAPADGVEKSVKWRDWNFTGYKTSGTIGMRVDRGVEAGKPVSGDANLKIALDAQIEAEDLRVVADIPVTRGAVGEGHFRILGIKGLSIRFQAGAVNGLSDNRKVKVEIPIELKWPTIIAGFPATFTQKFKFLVNTAFTAKNGTLVGSAAWDVDGSIGVDGHTVTLPTMKARPPKLIDTLEGISIGLNAMVVAVSFQFGYTIGPPFAGAGPVASFITSLGLTNGSSVGIVHCKQVSIDSVVTAGVLLSVSDPVKKALKTLLKYEVPEQATLYTKDVIKERWVKPNVAACK